MADWFELLRWVWLSGFVFCSALQICIWVMYPARMLGRVTTRQGAVVEVWPATSVIICARNEINNLRRHLVDILTQQYEGSWEVVVVDDDSTDNSLTWLTELARKYPHLRVIQGGPKQFAGKKSALTLGIMAAQYDWILLTDADCRPTTPHWISGMMTAALSSPETVIVPGVAPLEAGSGHLVQQFAVFEAHYTAMQYCTMALAGEPFMGVGRNLAWKKTVFEQTGGFKKHLNLPSGDDDLLVNAAATPGNTTICLHPDTMMYSAAPDTWSAWLRQKRRHLSAGLRYRSWHRLSVGAVAFTQAGHFGFGLLLLCWGGWSGLVLLVWGIRTALISYVYRRWLKVLNTHLPWWQIPFYDGLLALYFGAIAPVLMIFFSKKTVWK